MSRLKEMILSFPRPTRRSAVASHGRAKSIGLRLILIPAVGVILHVGTADAQSVNATPYVGGFFFSDGPWTTYWGEDIPACAVMGVRAGLRVSPSWGVEVSYGFVPLRTHEWIPAFVCITGPCDAPLVEFVETLNTHLYYGTVLYHLPLDLALRPFLSVGFGGITLDHERDPMIHDFVVTFGGGGAVSIGNTVELRWDLKDHLQLCEDAPITVGFRATESACPLEAAVLHHLEVSVGITLSNGALFARPKATDNRDVTAVAW